MSSFYCKRITKEQAQASLDAGRGTISIYSSHKKKQFFFTVHHMHERWQELKVRGFVPCTVVMPYRIVARPGFEDGWIKTVDQYIALHEKGMTEIDPDVEYPVKD